MNDSERRLIRFVCDGDMRNAQKAVKIILNSISSKKDEQFKENMLRKLESKREFIELPYNLQHLLIAEDTEEFPEARFLLRNEEKSITQKIIAIYDGIFSMTSPAKEHALKSYNDETERLIERKELSIKIADFLYQSDCGGKIRYGACKEILRVVGDYDNRVIYGYAGRENPARFKDFKEILKDCVDNKCFMVWE